MHAAGPGCASTASAGRSCSGGTLWLCACPPTPCPPCPAQTRPGEWPSMHMFRCWSGLELHLWSQQQHAGACWALCQCRASYCWASALLHRRLDAWGWQSCTLGPLMPYSCGQVLNLPSAACPLWCRDWFASLERCFSWNDRMEQKSFDN